MMDDIAGSEQGELYEQVVQHIYFDEACFYGAVGERSSDDVEKG